MTDPIRVPEPPPPPGNWFQRLLMGWYWRRRFRAGFRRGLAEGVRDAELINEAAERLDKERRGEI